MRTKRAIPISLSVLYAALLRRCGLHLSPVSFPGHFLLVANPEGGGRVFIDAFHRGRVLSEEELHALLAQQGVPFDERYLQPCAPREVRA